jgi:hypothetical protein
MTDYLFYSKAVGLEVSTEKTKFVLLTRYQNAGQNRNILIVTDQIFGNDSNKSYPDSGGN